MWAAPGGPSSLDLTDAQYRPLIDPLRLQDDAPGMAKEGADAARPVLHGGTAYLRMSIWSRSIRTPLVYDATAFVADLRVRGLPAPASGRQPPMSWVLPRPCLRSWRMTL